MRKTISILMFAALLAACAPAAAPAPAGEGPAPTLAPTSAPTQAVATQPPAPTAEPPTAVPESTAAPTAEPQPTAMVIQDTRQLMDVFKVSDPTTVNLAAGAPQFVEFFAFW